MKNQIEIMDAAATALDAAFPKGVKYVVFAYDDDEGMDKPGVVSNIPSDQAMVFCRRLWAVPANAALRHVATTVGGVTMFTA
jgi:hypothetical protein